MEKSYAYSTDTPVTKGERVTFKSPGGYVYSKGVSDSSNEPLHELTRKERRKIEKSKLNKLYHDPIEDGDYRPIQHTQEEIDQFHKALSGGLIQTANEKYVARRPRSNEDEDSNHQESDDQEPDGYPQAKIFDPESATLPADTASDPLYLMRGRFKSMLREHKYTHEVAITLEPLRYRKISERPVFSIEQLSLELKRAGAMCVRDAPLPGNKRLLECRFADVSEKQDAEDREMARAKREDLMNVTPDVLDSVIEDFLRLNCILSPAGEGYRIYTFFYSA